MLENTVISIGLEFNLKTKTPTSTGQAPPLTCEEIENLVFVPSAFTAAEVLVGSVVFCIFL